LGCTVPFLLLGSKTLFDNAVWEEFMGQLWSSGPSLNPHCVAFYSMTQSVLAGCLWHNFASSRLWHTFLSMSAYGYYLSLVPNGLDCKTCLFHPCFPFAHGYALSHVPMCQRWPRSPSESATLQSCQLSSDLTAYGDKCQACGVRQSSSSSSPAILMKAMVMP